MNGHQVIRLDPTGPELFCTYCHEFYPITTEYWHLKRNRQFRTDRCRLCVNERQRLYQALKRRDPAFRTSEKARHRNYYRQWVARTEPTLLPVYDREVLERERLRARTRRVA